MDEGKAICDMVSHGAKLKAIGSILGVDSTAVSKEVKRGRSRLTEEMGECKKTKRWPFVCDDCPKKYGKACAFTKWAYKPATAQESADHKLRESRKGIDMTPEEFKKAYEAIKAGVTEGISVFQITRGEGMPSASTAYRWISSGIASAKRIDLPMAAKCKKRSKRQHGYGGSSKGKEGRTYLDYLAYRRTDPGLFGWQTGFLGAIVSDK